MNVELFNSPVDVLSWIQAGPIQASQHAMIWCASRAQQTRVELAAITGKIDLLNVQVVTPVALATQRSKVRVLSVTERQTVLTSFLNSGQALLGPTLRELLSQPSGIDEIASALDQARLMSAGREEVLVHSDAHGHSAWAELAELIDGYADTLTQHGVTDLVGCFTGFASEFRDDSNVKQFWNDTPHFLSLEVDRFAQPALRLLTSLFGPSRPTNPAATSATCQGLLASPTIGGQWLRRSARLNNPTAATEIAEAETPQHESAPVQAPLPRLIQVKHPSMEAEAVVGELNRANDEGISWTSMFVVSPSTRSRLRSVARAASRAGIPVHGGPPPRLDGPIVDLITDLAAAIEHLKAEQLIASRPSEFVRTQIQRFLPDLGQRDSDVIEVALGLVRHAEHNDSLSLADWVLTLEHSPTAPTPPLTGPRNAVTLTTIDELRDVLANRTGQDPLVIVVGCVEGELPTRPTQEVFPAYVLDGPSDEPKRIAAHIASERWKLESIKQQTSSLTLIAAPDPGVLVSRFAEGVEKQQPMWKSRTIDRTRWNPLLATTQNDTPLVPEQKLSLSATQLTMFENCPWQYTVQYRLGLRTGGGVSARFGSYVHEVLEIFLAPFAANLATPEPDTPEPDTPEPDTPEPDSPETHEAAHVPIEHTLEGLLALANRLWTDDIIDHASQSDDFHQRAVDQFTNWWNREGERLVTSNEVAFVEYPFNIPIGEHRLKGFIDRIDQTPTGGVAIIDYKTGVAKTTAQVGDDLQLAVYHLAAVLDPSIAALGTVETLTLNYLKDSREIRQPIVSGHELVTKARIQSLIDEILDESYEPSTHANCDYCDLYRLCDLQLAGRPVPITLATKTGNNK